MYKWDSPHEWLTEKVRHCNDIEYLRGLVNSVVDKLDSDTIQDVFEHEMDDDGYFKPVAR